MRKLLFSSLKGYKLKWLRSDIIAALIVTAIAIPESLGYAIIVGLPVQAGLYCALLAPIVFAMFTSSKRLVVGADSATAALVASGAATIAVAGTAGYPNAIAVLGLVTGVILVIMSVARFGFLADLISQPVLVGFISGVGIQLLIGKLPDMLGIAAQGALYQKFLFLIMHISSLEPLTVLLSVAVVAIIIVGWKFRLPGALLGAILATKLLNLSDFGIKVIGTIPQGIPLFHTPSITFSMITHLLPAAFSIAIVILAQSLAVIRSSAARHKEKVHDNQDLMALGLANMGSAIIGGFAINGSPPRTSAGEIAGGRSQLINIFMAGFIGLTLVFTSGLFNYVPNASLAAIVFAIGLHLIKIGELKKIWSMRRTEFAIALIALASVATMGVQDGVMIAVILSLIERLRRQYHPQDEILLRDKVYAEWAEDRFHGRKHRIDAPSGLLIYRFSGTLFFENVSYFLKRADRAIKHAQYPVQYFLLEASGINDLDYTAAQALERLSNRLHTEHIQFGIAHASPRLRLLLERYKLIELIGSEHIFPSLRMGIEAYNHNNITNLERITDLHLSSNQYVVIGGTALEFLGIRETNDVDLVVNRKIYDRLKNDKIWKEYIQDSGKRILSKNGYKIMTSWMGKDLKKLQKTSVTMEGIPLMGINDIVECKTQLGRKKDMKDIERIKAYERTFNISAETYVTPAIVKAKYFFKK